jgi:hypothetical protein
MKEPIVRLYHHPINGDVFPVRVKPRSQQIKCKHIWRARLWSEVESGWESVCRLCGTTARGRRISTKNRPDG